MLVQENENCSLSRLSEKWANLTQNWLILVLHNQYSMNGVQTTGYLGWVSNRFLLSN